MNTCETCKFRHETECRRFPPAVFFEYAKYDYFPRVRLTDFCGEYQKVTGKESDG